MIRTLLFGGAAALALAASATAQPMHPMSAPPPGASSQVLPTPDFLAAAAQSDEFEIKEGHMAQMHGKSAKVREMGAMMVHDHTKSTAMIKAAAHRAGQPPMAPPPLAADQQQMVASLSGAHGADFDRMYVDQQVRAHTKTLGVMSAYASGGPQGPIRETAGKIVPVVQTHLDKFQSLKSEVG